MEHRRHIVLRIFLLLGLAAAAQAQTVNGITLSPSALTISYQIGSAALPASQTLQVQTTPKGLNFAVAISGSPYNAAWLLVSQSTGTSPTTLKVQANPTGLAAGTYVGTITITATSGSATYTQAAVVTLVIQSAAPAVTATPSSLNFTYTTGTPITSPSLSSAFILSSSGAALSATLSITGATWLKVTPNGNISVIGLLNTVSVSVDPTGLAPKVYTGTIKISAPSATNKTISMTVTLTVNAAVPTATSTWPRGVIEASPPTTVTIDGSSFFSNSTVAITGFAPASTVTVTDGTSTVSRTFYIPAYSSTATALRLAVASPLPSGTANAAYSAPLAAAGGTGPYSYEVVEGALPPGLSISGSAISGTPSAAGTFLATVQVTDHSTPPIQGLSPLELTIDPAGTSALRITVNAAPLPIGTVGAAYGPISLTAAGAAGPLTWSASSLPPGMTLSAAGVLAGSPSTDGSAGPVTAAIVSDTAALVTLPAVNLTQAGMIRLAVTTPAPGGGTSNEVPFQVYGPNPQITAVVNSASYQQGTLAPGDVIAIFGVGLGPSTLTIFDPSTPPIPAVLAGTSVTINGTAAPILYTSGSTIGAIVPYSISGSAAQVVVSYNGLASQPFATAVAASDPGIYSLASSGQGQGAILNYDSSSGNFSINASSNPAAKGSIVVLYITGAGATTSAVSNQLIPTSPAVTPVQSPTVTIGGQGATVLAAQAPPGSIPGLIQLNVTVPATVKAGQAVPIVVTVGGISSQAGLTMAVK
jgi:uncharacterized protein (TIGR03437 family)